LIPSINLSPLKALVGPSTGAFSFDRATRSPCARPVSERGSTSTFSPVFNGYHCDSALLGDVYAQHTGWGWARSKLRARAPTSKAVPPPRARRNGLDSRCGRKGRMGCSSMIYTTHIACRKPRKPSASPASPHPMSSAGDPICWRIEVLDAAIREQRDGGVNGSCFCSGTERQPLGRFNRLDSAQRNRLASKTGLAS